MPTKAIIIKREDVAEYLETQLDREPTFKEVEDFLDYLEVDVPQWLRDNAKTFLRQRSMVAG
ncbi:MAG: hypothetical protein HWN71_09965 [Desulfobacterales bacterium]|nr:hypothetical protein [Desulfobacterales bacterium]